MSGAGNDFIVLDARGLPLDFEALAKSLCASFGADGFLALDESETADFRLHFYNPDGLRGEMCGNGARCICKFARDLGIVGDTMTVETDAGMVYGWYLGGDQYRIRLNLPSLIGFRHRPDCTYLELGCPGLPHSTTQVPDLDYSQKEQLRPYALEIRHDPVFQKGVNVNLYRMLDDTHARLLTFERGVEDFTLACGTGSACVALTRWMYGNLPDGRLEVENPGGVLTVTLETQDRKLTDLYLEGPAVTLEEYEI